MIISLEGIARVIIFLIIAGGIFWLLFWLIDYVGIPEPFHKFARLPSCVRRAGSDWRSSVVRGVVSIRW